ncbi:MAG: hypothetical protein I3273_04535 [Candidatus Moeniiplasma glomeromycotorum]|nr:hypothetical protein [Candidatus Moeniiplasma glomeromycotorum]MCE8169362.1 hypothetical protein [Candidatus Moeniiplasma glomeromycotorum]
MKYNRELELSINRLAFTLESLEEYIRHAGYYSDWSSKEQFYRRSIGDGNKWDLENDEEHFFSNLWGAKLWFEDEPESIRQETQKEFYKWIDYSGITAENCPEKLKHYLNEINEILEGRGDKFYQAYEQQSKKWWKSIRKNEKKSQIFWQAEKETTRFFFGDPVPTEPKEIRDVKIKGNAKQGQKTFQQIKGSIAGNHEWTFPWSEKYSQKLKEKIEELEAKKGQLPSIQPKEDWKPDYIISTFDDILREDLELYIQKLDYYPNWKAHEWENKENQEHWEKKSISEVKGLTRVGLKTMNGILNQFKTNDPDYYPILINKLKSKFLQWQKERKIEIGNSPHKLRKILLKFNEILDGNHPWKNMGNKEKNNKNIPVPNSVKEYFRKNNVKSIEWKGNHYLTLYNNEEKNNGIPSLTFTLNNPVFKELEEYFSKTNKKVLTRQELDLNKENEENNESEQEKIAQIIIELSLEISELTKKYQIKITDLDPEFKHWKSKIKHADSISEAQKIQEQIREKIKTEEAKHQSPTTSPENNNKLSLPVKICIGTGIIGLILAGIIIIRQIIKKRKHKK